MPHPPQWVGSVCSSTHEAPHATPPSRQVRELLLTRSRSRSPSRRLHHAAGRRRSSRRSSGRRRRSRHASGQRRWSRRASGRRRWPPRVSRVRAPLRARVGPRVACSEHDVAEAANQLARARREAESGRGKPSRGRTCSVGSVTHRMSIHYFHGSGTRQRARGGHVALEPDTLVTGSWHTGTRPGCTESPDRSPCGTGRRGCRETHT